MSFVKAEVKGKVNHVNILYVFIIIYYLAVYNSAPEPVTGSERTKTGFFFLLYVSINKVKQKQVLIY